MGPVLTHLPCFIERRGGEGKGREEKGRKGKELAPQAVTKQHLEGVPGSG